MYTTSVSLLEKLRRPGEEEAWNKFVELYTPLFYYWACRLGLQAADASDLVQEVLTVLVRKLPEFRYDGRQSFRGWLRTIALNKWRDHRRRRQPTPLPENHPVLADLEASEASDAFWETEYRERLVSRALQLMQSKFQSTTWQACWESVVAERPGAVVAAELGMSIDAVYAARSRVLRHLRQELDGLLE